MTDTKENTNQETEKKTSYSMWFWLIGMLLFLFGMAEGIPILQNYLADSETKQLLLAFQNDYFSLWAYFDTDSYLFLNTPLVRVSSGWRLFFALGIWLVLATLIYLPFSFFKNNKVANFIFRSIICLLFFIGITTVYFVTLEETIIDTTKKVFFIKETPFVKAKKINFSDVQEIKFDTKRTSTADQTVYLIILEISILEKNGTQTKIGERPLQEINIQKEEERELYRREPAPQKVINYINYLEVEMKKLVGITK